MSKTLRNKLIMGYEGFESSEIFLDEQLCKCRTLQPIFLMVVLDSFPIRCVYCFLPVPFKKLNLDKKTIESIDKLSSTYKTVLDLSSDSKKHESLLVEQFKNINSKINLIGREAQKKINEFRRCYFHYTGDMSLHITDCPVCKKSLKLFKEGTFKLLKESPFGKNLLKKFKDIEIIFGPRICKDCSIITFP